MRSASAKPVDYKIICISLYLDDIARAGRLVRARKARGLRKMTRSEVIREALRLLELAEVGHA